MPEPQPARARCAPGYPALAACLALLCWSGWAEAQTLRGSPASLERQNAQARAHGFTYLRTPADVHRFVEQGHLVRVHPNADFDVHNVSFPYARPEVRLFIERLASQYRSACGEKLVVTSLVRPIIAQPSNASSESVHPTGMALDLRVSQNARCRSWLESTLLSLERQGLVEAIRERNPPHYHVAVYPQPYAAYVANVTGDPALVERARAEVAGVRLGFIDHTVRRGENLTQIARRYGTSVARLRAENGMSGSQLIAGQTLRVPVYHDAADTSLAAAEPTTGAIEVLVARGDTLWNLAQRYGTTVAAIRRANGLASNLITVGQRLLIPGGALEASVRPAEAGAFAD